MEKSSMLEISTVSDKHMIGNSQQEMLMKKIPKEKVQQ